MYNDSTLPSIITPYTSLSKQPTHKRPTSSALLSNSLKPTRNKNNPTKNIRVHKHIDLIRSLDPDHNGQSYFQRRSLLQQHKMYIIWHNLHKQMFNQDEKMDIKSKRENLEKMESRVTEKKMENSLKQMCSQLEQKKAMYNELVNNINTVVNDKNLCSLQIDVINAYDRECVNTITFPSLGGRRLDKETKFKEMSQRVAEKVKREEEKKALEDKINYQNELADKMRTELCTYRTEINQLRSNIKELKIKLNDHYHFLLYEGNDFRSEGLITLIKNIWNIGMNVDISFMPKYLDEISIDYLFTAARKSIEISKMKEVIDKAKVNCSKVLKMENDKDNKQQSNEIIPFFETRLQDNNVVKDKYPHTTKFMEKYCKQRAHIIEMSNMNLKQVKEMIANRKELSKDVITHFAHIEQLKQMLFQMEKEFSENKRMEIARISKEFLNNDYSRKYNVKIETVFAALCGEEGKNKELVSYTKMKQDIADNSKKVKFYATFKYTPKINVNKKINMPYKMKMLPPIQLHKNQETENEGSNEDNKEGTKEIIEENEHENENDNDNDNNEKKINDINNNIHIENENDSNNGNDDNDIQNLMEEINEANFNEDIIDFQMEALNKHNQYRFQHNMNPLKINPQLNEQAMIFAHFLADGNKELQHSYNLINNNNNNENNTNQQYGENLYLVTDHRPSGSEVSTFWYNEISNQQYSEEQKQGETNNEYINITDPNIREVGFGIFQGTDSDNYYVVAHYYPYTNNFI